MSRLILFNKPYLVLCQFTDPFDDPSKRSGRRLRESLARRLTLANYIPVPGVYPAGRLDYDSEGLVLLTNSGKLQQRISDPRHKLPKTYWVQVEGLPVDEALCRLEKGILLKDGPTLPARVRRMNEPSLWPRNPPIRYRKSVPTSWLEIVLTEGRKRQVRRMTAALGFPTLRLVRVAVGQWELGELKPGEWEALIVEER